MTPYEFSGAVIRATAIFVFVEYGEGPEDYLWLQISKNDARLITADAKEEKEDGHATEDIDAEMRGTELYVGGAALDDDEEEPDEPEEEEADD
jgi:hypothetical protein